MLNIGWLLDAGLAVERFGRPTNCQPLSGTFVGNLNLLGEHICISMLGDEPLFSLNDESCNEETLESEELIVAKGL